MEQAEAIVAQQITDAFNGVATNEVGHTFKDWQEIPNSWIEENEDMFAYYSHSDELFLLPAYMCYLLRTDRSFPESTIYLNICNTLREYSKEKSNSCFKNRLTDQQFYAVRAFIKHFTHNKAVNLDLDQWAKTLSNWSRSEK